MFFGEMIHTGMVLELKEAMNYVSKIIQQKIMSEAAIHNNKRFQQQVLDNLILKFREKTNTFKKKLIMKTLITTVPFGEVNKLPIELLNRYDVDFSQ